MESLCVLIRAGIPRSRASTNSFALHGLRLIVGSVAAFASFAALATSAAETPRFQLIGSGTLTVDGPVQKSGNVQLKASLTPSGAALSASPPVQAGGGFALMASIAAASMVCYNDTIFRDDFDGDGF